MRPLNDIVEQYQERKRQLQLINTQRQYIRDMYNGDISVPVLDKNTDPAVINILRQGVDAHADRIASTQPDAIFLPKEWGIDKWIKKADLQRQVALINYWKSNHMETKDRRRARNLVAYGSAPIVILPDLKNERPEWQVRDPLGTFPAPTNDPDELVPPDCIFTYTRTYQWIKSHYPNANLAKFFNAGVTANTQKEMRFTLIEYIDDHEIILGLVNESPSIRDNYAYTANYQSISGINNQIELDRIPNRARRPLAITPQRVNLDRNHGQFDGLVGMFLRQAELMELSWDVAKRGARPEQWAIARPGEVPKIVNDADPDEGIVGVITGAELKDMAPQPAFDVIPMLDRLERMQRSEGSTPVEFGAEQGGSSTRTSLRGNAVMNAGISFPVQASQQLLAVSKEEELKAAMAVDRGYFGKVTKSVAVGWKGQQKRLEYKPNELMDTDEVYVKYSHAGADVNQETAILGQLVGMELLSHETAGRQHPFIEDWDLEHERITAEKLEAAMIVSTQQQAESGQMAPEDIAKVYQYTRQENYTFADALLKVHEEAQKRQEAQMQAQMAQQQAGTSTPGAPGQPGLAAPGSSGAPQAPPTAEQLPQGLSNVVQNIGKFASAQRGVTTLAGQQ